MKDPSSSINSFRKLLKTSLFDKLLLHRRICGSFINLRGEMCLIIIIIIHVDKDLGWSGKQLVVISSKAERKEEYIFNSIPFTILKKTNGMLLFITRCFEAPVAPRHPRPFRPPS